MKHEIQMNPIYWSEKRVCVIFHQQLAEPVKPLSVTSKSSCNLIKTRLPSNQIKTQPHKLSDVFRKYVTYIKIYFI